MIMRRSSLLTGLIAFVGLFVRPALADTITNGNFQTGNLAGWTVFTTSDGTNGTGLPNVVLFNTTGVGASEAAHFNVGEVVFNLTQQGGGLSQAISAPVPGLYTLTEDFASQNSTGETNEDGGTFSTLIDGTVVATDSLGSIGAHQTLRGSFGEVVSLTAGSHIFETEITRAFQSQVGDTPDQYLDNISLVPVSTPEPSSFVLFATGILSCAGAFRCKFFIR